jgi:L-lactate utilization protein LutB
MTEFEKMYYEKRASVLVKNLRSRHFEAYYCDTRQDALAKALELIPEGSLVSWGGAMSAQQIGLIGAMRVGNYRTIDRDKCVTAEEREQAMKDALFCDTFLMGANAMSMDGQMVSIDGTGNRIGALVYGPKSVIVIVGMNKVADNLDEAIRRARTVAAPKNKQRFGDGTPCAATGICGDCKSEKCICNHIVVTRHCRPVGRIKFIIVGEDLGL